MSKFIQTLHSIYAGAVFGILFILTMPFFMVPILIPSLYKWTGVINRVWAHAFLTLIFIPYKVEYRFKPDKKSNYIFCPNHFSYMDIPSMGLNPINTIFVGKNDMESIPVFGYMYRKLHITVNRSSVKSRYETLLRSAEAVRDGKSLVIFPEGGIVTRHPPRMGKFKDGAFRTAIEQQIPIVPVTIPYNWIILPDGSFLPRRRKMKVIFHSPILTDNLTMEDLPELRQKSFQIIEQELVICNNEN